MSNENITPDKVREAISGGVKKAELAREAGVHVNTLLNVDKPEWNPRWDTLETLCEAADRLIKKEKKIDKT